MTNNSCIVVLNGHGCFKTDYILDMHVSNFMYHLIFPCRYHESISNAHHNLLLNNIIIQRLDALRGFETYDTTVMVNNTYPAEIDTIVNCRANRLLYKHSLSNAEDVPNVHTLTEFDPTRFEQCITSINTEFGTQGLCIQFDTASLIASIRAAHDGALVQRTELAPGCILFIRPIMHGHLERTTLDIEHLMSDVLPRITIAAVFDSNHDIIICKAVLTEPALPQGLQLLHEVEVLDHYGIPEIGSGQSYHEMYIAGDANIIWDACRVEEI